MDMLQYWNSSLFLWNSRNTCHTISSWVTIHTAIIEMSVYDSRIVRRSAICILTLLVTGYKMLFWLSYEKDSIYLNHQFWYNINTLTKMSQFVKSGVSHTSLSLKIHRENRCLKSFMLYHHSKLLTYYLHAKFHEKSKFWYTPVCDAPHDICN